MSEAPFFSIVLCVLNRRTELPRAVESVLAQREASYELVLVDNMSTDGSYEYCRSIDDARVRTVRCETPGLAFARNTGIREARGRWIVLLDSDNTLAGEYALRDAASRVALHAEQRPGTRVIFFSTVDETGRPCAGGELFDRPLTLGDFTTRIWGEFSPTVEAEWFKAHLYPEIVGARTEFPCCVWFRAAVDGALLADRLVTQRYFVGAGNRICSVAVSDARARELALYFYMLLRDYGAVLRAERAWRAYALYVVKFLLYNRLAAAVPSGDAASVCAPWLSSAAALVPRRVIRSFIEAYKRRSWGST